MEIKEKLTHLRAEKNWNRSETARQANIKRTTYETYEIYNRFPSSRNILAVAKALQVTAEYLLDTQKGYPPAGADRLTEE